MASLTPEEKSLFPLKTIQSVVKLFQSILTRAEEPDLSLISVIVGYIENTLCANPVIGLQNSKQGIANESSKDLVPIGSDADFPALQIHVVEGLHAKFRAMVRSAVDLTQYDCGDGFASRDAVKRVSDVIWNTLLRSYHKDRAHIQNLYSYITGSKLDCFGVALAVIAGCQALGLDDVHLAMSEDHVWAVFGPRGSETCEITWHGRGNEDKRGQPVDAGVQSQSWLYAAGKPVTGDRFTEVASIFASMNPAVNSTTDNLEVASLQQQLLWLLYDLGHLSKYPMALGNLADLEEQNPASVPNRPHCDELFLKAIRVSQLHFDDYHVYPYTYQAGYFYRNRMFKEALESWANAADVIRKYNYSREDEEIYKEFLEIANELIPHVIKVEGSGHNARSILKDPKCFSHLLRFYDGICQWEEDSTTPVLHIGWAKPLVNTISKFDAQVRRLVAIECVVTEGSDSESPSVSNEGCRLMLKSQKMAGLKDLLLAEKLNTQAISLQLTAQSQVQLGGRKAKEDVKDGKSESKEASKEVPASRSKRLRKE